MTKLQLKNKYENNINFSFYKKKIEEKTIINKLLLRHNVIKCTSTSSWSSVFKHLKNLFIVIFFRKKK